MNHISNKGVASMDNHSLRQRQFMLGVTLLVLGLTGAAIRVPRARIQSDDKPNLAASDRRIVEPIPLEQIRKVKRGMLREEVYSILGHPNGFFYSFSLEEYYWGGWVVEYTWTEESELTVDSISQCPLRAQYETSYRVD